MTDDGLGSRFRFVRGKWHLSQSDLAARSGVDGATVQGVEAGAIDPDQLTIWKLAHAQHVYPEWLRGDDLPMIPLAEMTVPAQHAAQNGPGSEGLPGYVVIDPGGPWYRGADEEWTVDPTAEGKKQR